MQVILTEDDQRWLNWANQFRAADINSRDRVIFPTSRGSRADALSFIAQAASRAGQSQPARVIISVGHGAVAAGGGAAWVDLAPGGRFRLEHALITNVSQRQSDATIIQNVRAMAGSTTPSLFCNELLRPTGSASRTRLPEGIEPLVAELRCRGFPAATTRTEMLRDYLRFGEILRQNNVTEVMFLACSIGSAAAFMDRIAADWHVSILAYSARIAADEDGEQNRIRVYRVGHQPVPGTPSSRRCETELPQGYITRP